MSMEPDDARMDVWRAFLETHAALLDILEAELERERGMPLTWYDVLVQISARGGRLRMQDLAHSLLLSKSGLTRLFDRMEQAGLVKREPCPFDRRGTFAALTPAGSSALRNAAPVHLRGVQEHFARHLNDAESTVMCAALRRILDALPHPAKEIGASGPCAPAITATVDDPGIDA